jgi:predicted Zn finger-like uncharacterized protein
MHVTCPSCKFGGTVRDDQIPPEGKEVYCPNCNVKFRIRKDQTPPAKPPQIPQETHATKSEQPEYLPVSCPVCGFTGKLKRSSVVGGKLKKITCPSCKNPFTFTPSDSSPPPDSDPLYGRAHKDTPSSCPSCGSPIQHLLPVCPSCGRVLTGIKIYCPSCKSTNVGIRSDTHNDGGSRWETTIFKPVSLTIENSEDILIPLSCRDCGWTWTIQPALTEATEGPAGFSPEGN